MRAACGVQKPWLSLKSYQKSTCPNFLQARGGLPIPLRQRRFLLISTRARGDDGPSSQPQPSTSDNAAAPSLQEGSPPAAEKGSNGASAGIPSGSSFETSPFPSSTNTFWIGNGYLLIVSILWGSYSPALRAVFNLPGAPAPLVVAASRGVLQACLLGLALTATAYFFPNSSDTTMSSSTTDADAKNSSSAHPSTSASSTAAGTAGFSSISPAVLGAIEIGAYNTMGTLLQTWGISLSSATRAAFLVQATAVFTPALSAAFGMAPSRLLWGSSFIALLATILVTLDQTDLSSTSSLSAGSILAGASLGDLGALGAAFFYSLSTVRIPRYAQRVPPLRLAFGKSLMLAGTSLALLSWQSFESGVSVSSLWPGCCSDPTAWAIIAWSAVGPGAVSAFLHVKGQSMVGPTDAQIVFASVPLWSALIAAAFLPGESMGALAWIGGAGMLAAGLVAALGNTAGQRPK